MRRMGILREMAGVQRGEFIEGWYVQYLKKTLERRYLDTVGISKTTVRKETYYKQVLKGKDVRSRVAK